MRPRNVAKVYKVCVALIIAAFANVLTVANRAEKFAGRVGETAPRKQTVSHLQFSAKFSSYSPTFRFHHSVDSVQVLKTN